VLHHVKNAPSSPLRRFLALVTSALLVAGLFAGASLATAEPAAAAPSGSTFDPGFIISDTAMFDWGSMTTDDIQTFLNAKVAACSTTAAEPCLKDYRTDTHDIAAVANRCTGNITGASNQSAAQVIVAVAVACEVSPKVLLVTLQKEQGLVTSTSPTSTKYRIAMGYGCPDTAPCDSEYFGFFNQVYQAAYAFNKYTKSPDQYTAYQPGTRSIKYNPKNSCGAVNVNIRNKATSALYFYTPYVPNAAALANVTGVGDSCSSYGNRNFWRYYTDWFGSPIGGSFVVDTDAGRTFVLIDGVKWELPAGRTDLLKTLAPLGNVGRVSNAYVDAFPGGAQFGNLVSSATGQLYLLDNGLKYTLKDCAQAAEYGFACSTAVTMSDDMLTFFGNSGPVSSYIVTAAGAQFVLGAGQKRELLDIASATAANISLPAANLFLDGTLSAVPYGAPIVRQGALVSARGTNNLFISTSSGTYIVTRAFLDQSKLAARVGTTAAGALDPGSLEYLPNQVVFSGLFTEPATGISYVLTKTGKTAVSNPQAWGGTFVSVDPEFAALMPANGQAVAAPVFVKDLGSGVKFLVKKGKRQPAATSSAVKALAKKNGIATTTVSLATETVLASGSALIAPATVVKQSAKSTALWFIDGASKKRPVTSAQAKELTGSAKARVVPKSTIDGFATVKGAAKLGLKSAGVRYVADGGILRVVSAADSKRYGSKFGFGSYDATTIAALKKGAAIGRVIKSGSKYYEVKNGKKVRISAATAKGLAAATGKKTQAVTAYFAKQLTTK
jgi:hypothetical protein